MSGRGRGRGRGRAPPSGARLLLQRSAQEAGLDAGNLRSLQDITKPALFPDYEWHSNGHVGHETLPSTVSAFKHGTYGTLPCGYGYDLQRNMTVVENCLKRWLFMLEREKYCSSGFGIGTSICPIPFCGLQTASRHTLGCSVDWQF